MTEQIQAIAELIANIPGATVEISGDSIKISGVNSLSSKSQKVGGKKRKAKKLPKVISSEQFEQLVSVVNPSEGYPTGAGRRDITDLRNRAIIEMFYRTGIRVQELCDLTPADVNLGRCNIYIQEGKCSKDRYVPFGEELLSWLSKWVEVRPQNAEYFFCTAKGEQLSSRYVRAMIERISKQAGVYIQDGKEQKPVWPHALRHTCATNWLNDGLSIRDVQELLGHEKLDTTMIYTHVSMSNLEEKIKALG